VAYTENYYLDEVFDYLRQASELRYIDKFVVKHGDAIHSNIQYNGPAALVRAVGYSQHHPKYPYHVIS
jgi:aminoglycoside phosphotransferase